MKFNVYFEEFTDEENGQLASEGMNERIKMRGGELIEDFICLRHVEALFYTDRDTPRKNCNCKE